MVPLRRRAVLAILAFVALAGGQLGGPPAAAAADGSTDTATTTYTVDPAGARIDVAMDVTVTNSKASTTTYVPCTTYQFDPATGWHPVQGTCPSTTTYYITETYVWVEKEATGIRVSADRGTASLAVYKRDALFIVYRVTFARIDNGQTRKLHLTYAIPGGAPRSSSPIRIGKAAVSFCVIANGFDGGAVQVFVPAAFELQVDAHNGSLTASSTGGAGTYATGALRDPASFWACLDGEDPAGYATTSLVSPGGRTILLKSWPEDPTWNADIKGQIGQALVRLEELIGRPLPGAGPITVREVTAGDLGAYAGTFDEQSQVARVGEDLDQPGVVAHELSHAWFNDSLFDTRWLSEGSAEWAETTITGRTCADPGAAPAPDLHLSTWVFAGPKATAAELAAVDYEYAAACYVVQSLAGRVGPTRMRAVLGSLLDRKIAYRSGTLVLPGHGGPETWRDWLDAMDELGLVPAGVTDLDLAQALLARFGGAPDAASLPARSKARAAYHALLGKIGDWTLPAAILGPMASWHFDAAMAAIAAEGDAYSDVTAADAALPGLDLAHGRVKELVDAAASGDEMLAAATSARDQEAAAVAVGAARAALERPRGPLAEIGLLGTDLAATLAAGVAAVRAIDLPTATARADAIENALAGADAAGGTRLGLAAGILVLVLAVLLIRRRRRRGLSAVDAVVPGFGDSDRTPDMATDSAASDANPEQAP